MAIFGLISLIAGLVLTWASPAPTIQTYETMAAIELQSLGIKPKLATLAPIRLIDKDSAPFGGVYWTLDGPCAVGIIGDPGTIDLVNYTPERFNRNMIGALIHEQLHALVDNMTEAEQETLDRLMAENPTVATSMGYAAYEYHPGELTRYADQVFGTTLMEAGMPLDEATKQAVMAAEDSVRGFPRPIVDFINPIIDGLEPLTGGCVAD